MCFLRGGLNICQNNCHYIKHAAPTYKQLFLQAITLHEWCEIVSTQLLVVDLHNFLHLTGASVTSWASRWHWNRLDFYSSVASPASNQSDCWKNLMSGIEFDQQFFLWRSRCSWCLQRQHHIVNQALDSTHGDGAGMHMSYSYIYTYTQLIHNIFTPGILLDKCIYWGEKNSSNHHRYSIRQ